VAVDEAAETPNTATYPEIATVDAPETVTKLEKKQVRGRKPKVTPSDPEPVSEPEVKIASVFELVDANELSEPPSNPKRGWWRR
jgi:hypothetical protein